MANHQNFYLTPSPRPPSTSSTNHPMRIDESQFGAVMETHEEESGATSGGSPVCSAQRPRPFRSLGSDVYTGAPLTSNGLTCGSNNGGTANGHYAQQQNILFRMLSNQAWSPSSDSFARSEAAAASASELGRFPIPADFPNDPASGLVSGVEFLSPADYRQRSQSMGSNVGWGGPGGAGRYPAPPSDLSRNSSHDSLASYDSLSETGGTQPRRSPIQTELEVTRSKLMNLLMAGGGGGGESDGAPPRRGDNELRPGSLSNPGTPPRCSPTALQQSASRKYSDCSQNKHLKAKLMSAKRHLPSAAATGCERTPGDMLLPRGDVTDIRGGGWLPAGQWRRKPYSRPDVTAMGARNYAEVSEMDDGGPVDEGIGDDQSSLLKLALMRGRSQSLSIYESARLLRRTAATAPLRRQSVALAKKNLLPIVARVSDRLGKVIEFAASLPEFTRMPACDQETLLVGACPRLLLLYMAEMNLQFAVTPVNHEDGGRGAGGAGGGAGSPSGGAVPTAMFVEGVQTFIRKCQAMGVSANEYFYMRMIALFHTGSGAALALPEAAARIHSEARQDLQELVLHHHPTERQRYFTLLLTLHTLFGVNGAMLTALFCDPIFAGGNGGGGGGSGGGLRGFICERLSRLNLGTPGVVGVCARAVDAV